MTRVAEQKMMQLFGSVSCNKRSCPSCLLEACVADKMGYWSVIGRACPRRSRSIFHVAHFRN